MSSFENSPAAKLVATHCCACGRALVDAVSVELGIGPVCRRKHGFDIDVDDSIRARANQLVHAIATGMPGIAQAVEELEALGFGVLASKLRARNNVRVDVTIALEDSYLAVKAPYAESAVELMRSIPGRKWDRARKMRQHKKVDAKLLGALADVCQCWIESVRKARRAVGLDAAQAAADHGVSCEERDAFHLMALGLVSYAGLEATPNVLVVPTKRGLRWNGPGARAAPDGRAMFFVPAFGSGRIEVRIGSRAATFEERDQAIDTLDMMVVGGIERAEAIRWLAGALSRLRLDAGGMMSGIACRVIAELVRQRCPPAMGSSASAIEASR